MIHDHKQNLNKRYVKKHEGTMLLHNRRISVTVQITYQDDTCLPISLFINIIIQIKRLDVQ